MTEPSVAVALLQLFCRDEALAGDILEEFERRQSRAWLWRQVAVAVMFGLPYGMVRRQRAGQKMPMPIGMLGAAGVATLITIVAPAAWWLVAFGAIGGVLVAIALVAVTRRRVLGQPAGRRNLLS
jgi:hypothetical protein